MNIHDVNGLIKGFFGRPPKRDIPAAVNVSAAAVDYIANCATARTMVTLATIQDTLRALPFWAPRRGGTIGRLAIENTASAGANNFRIGLYRNVADRRSLYPGALLADSGNFTGAAALQTYACSVALEPNVLYWLVCNTSATVTLRALDPSAVGDILGLTAGATGANPSNLYISVASAYGALPDPFPAGGAYVSGNVNVPVLRYQFSA